MSDQAEFEMALERVANQDVEGLIYARTHYGDSWRKRGGVGAFMMLARKWDRLEQLLSNPKGFSQYDVLEAIKVELGENKEGVLDSVRDLRRYLMLVEAYLLQTGVPLPLSRDNKEVTGKDLCKQRFATTQEGFKKFVPSNPDARAYDSSGQSSPFGYSGEEAIMKIADSSLNQRDFGDENDSRVQRAG